MGLIDRLTADVTCLKGALRTLRMTTHIASNPTRIFPEVIEELAEKYGDAPALLSDRERFSYRALDERSNRYARWALAQGLGKGDTVCLLMPNRPEFMAIWLGITRVGGVVALLNTNLTGPSLAHCINVVAPAHIIVAAELARRVRRPRARTSPATPRSGCTARPTPTCRASIARSRRLPGDDARRTAERRQLTIEDRALYIYTSGTTGLPKAANVNHYRLMLASHGFAGVMDTARQRPHVRLPADVSHRRRRAGDRRRAGRRRLGRDPRALLGARILGRHRALGLHAVPIYRRAVPLPASTRRRIRTRREHKLRLACGNGLRPDIWAEFKARFRIPQILEFYARDRRQRLDVQFRGQGRRRRPHPLVLAHRFPTKVVRFDVEREQPVRDEHGFCIDAAPTSPARRSARSCKDAVEARQPLRGLCDARARPTRKILRDVFEKGDAWFRTGDLMRKDEDGYFYFVDRIGDTFRWKGENVSTTEVAEAIGAFPASQEANVYGVGVPGRDGRAGMAAIVAKDNFNLTALARASDRAAAGICAAGVPAPARRHRRHRAPSSRRRSIS